MLLAEVAKNCHVPVLVFSVESVLVHLPTTWLDRFAWVQSLGSLARSCSSQGDLSLTDGMNGSRDGKSYKKTPKFERLRLTSGGQEGGLHVRSLSSSSPSCYHASWHTIQHCHCIGVGLLMKVYYQ